MQMQTQNHITAMFTKKNKKKTQMVLMSVYLSIYHLSQAESYTQVTVF